MTPERRTAPNPGLGHSLTAALLPRAQVILETAPFPPVSTIDFVHFHAHSDQNRPLSCLRYSPCFTESKGHSSLGASPHFWFISLIRFDIPALGVWMFFARFPRRDPAEIPAGPDIFELGPLGRVWSCLSIRAAALPARTSLGARAVCAMVVTDRGWTGNGVLLSYPPHLYLRLSSYS